jgi:hypothetical protein
MDAQDGGLRRRVPHPVYRKLRVFAIDPGMTARFDSAVLNEMTLAIPWESLEPGPTGEYVQIVDQDEHGRQVHDSVNLGDPEILAQDGLSPSDGNPRFRQQMVYAVAMRTIRNFERSLGRLAHWLPDLTTPASPGVPPVLTYRKRLTLYPHWSKVANAFWDPGRGLCFGYFQGDENAAFPGTTVFTCLSQDVIAHELTHALLGGMKITFDGRNPDVYAFHEAFADLISLLQHFWMSDVLRQQFAATRGRLDVRSALGAVAPQFGEAVGKPDGLRNALGYTDAKGHWQPRVANPKAYRTEFEPHARGDILVGAVFDALTKIYESRVADLRRIATKGTGILPDGNLHPDLVNRFAREASRSAQRVLDMCLRALDYIAPVEVTFGDFLRAVVTADADVAPTDDSNYRLAFVDAFRRYGILPEGVDTLSIESLLWPVPPAGQADVVADFVKKLSKERTPWNMPQGRQELWELLQEQQVELHTWLREKADRLGPIDLTQPFEVQSFHPRERGALTGDLAFQWVIKIVQDAPRTPAPKRRSKKAQQEADAEPPAQNGVTLLVDADSGRVRYLIEKHAAPPKAGTVHASSAPVGTMTPTRPATERRLRVFAFDPSLSGQRETSLINEVIVRVPWERDQQGESILGAGPIGEYLEVIDRDSASGCFYDPVDLNDEFLLAQDGLPPSESNPQFHQQMVYAVAMRTVRIFEHALGRLALWRPHAIRDATGHVTSEQYVQRLRLYPHALREANAYYSPQKKAILFGYFSAPVAEGFSESARITVFTCLSHDIIAHEVTHALLDGMHRRFSEPSNPDVLAFHEAFADLVALFQHFTLPEVLRHQIATTRGDLASQNRLGELAQQFGQAVGKRGALRSALGELDEHSQWRRREPTPGDYQRYLEPHDRGAVLVAAVFDAFLAIYKSRVADLLRIASEGTGVLPQGHLHPDLVNRLADEAAASARVVLEMCIRALDYCPPVDITFGDYLRAIVTADFEYEPVDEEHRRVAFVEAFRRRGIVPEGVQAFSVDGLLWRPASSAPDEDEEVVVGIVKDWASDIRSWGLTKNREVVHDLMHERRAALHEYLKPRVSRESVVLSGIDPDLGFEVHSLRPSIRLDWWGKPTFQWVIELTQRIPQYFDDADRTTGATPDYYFRGGCTLVVDAQTGKVRYSIKKKLDEARKARQRAYSLDEGNRTLAATYFGRLASDDREPFAMLHRF